MSTPDGFNPTQWAAFLWTFARRADLRANGEPEPFHLVLPATLRAELDEPYRSDSAASLRRRILSLDGVASVDVEIGGEFQYYDRHGTRRYREPGAVSPWDDDRLYGHTRLLNSLLSSRLTLDEFAAMDESCLEKLPGLGVASLRLAKQLVSPSDEGDTE